MRIRLTKPENVDRILDKLDQQFPFGECNDTFIKYAVPVIKERLTKGETVYLETEISNTAFGFCQILSYWSPDDVPTCEEYLEQNDE